MPYKEKNDIREEAILLPGRPSLSTDINNNIEVESDKDMEIDDESEERSKKRQREIGELRDDELNGSKQKKQRINKRANIASAADDRSKIELENVKKNLLLALRYFNDKPSAPSSAQTSKILLQFFIKMLGLEKFKEIITEKSFPSKTLLDEIKKDRLINELQKEEELIKKPQKRILNIFKEVALAKLLEVIEDDKPYAKSINWLIEQNKKEGYYEKLLRNNLEDICNSYLAGIRAAKNLYSSFHAKKLKEQRQDIIDVPEGLIQELDQIKIDLKCAIQNYEKSKIIEGASNGFIPDCETGRIILQFFLYVLGPEIFQKVLEDYTVIKGKEFISLLENEIEKDKIMQNLIKSDNIEEPILSDNIFSFLKAINTETLPENIKTDSVTASIINKLVNNKKDNYYYNIFYANFENIYNLYINKPLKRQVKEVRINNIHQPQAAISSSSSAAAAHANIPYKEESRKPKIAKVKQLEIQDIRQSLIEAIRYYNLSLIGASSDLKATSLSSLQSNTIIFQFFICILGPEVFKEIINDYDTKEGDKRLDIDLLRQVIDNNNSLQYLVGERIRVARGPILNILMAIKSKELPYGMKEESVTATNIKYLIEKDKEGYYRKLFYDDFEEISLLYLQFTKAKIRKVDNTADEDNDNPNSPVIHSGNLENYTVPFTSVERYGSPVNLQLFDHDLQVFGNNNHEEVSGEPEITTSIADYYDPLRSLLVDNNTGGEPLRDGSDKDNSMSLGGIRFDSKPNYSEALEIPISTSTSSYVEELQKERERQNQSQIQRS